MVKGYIYKHTSPSGKSYIGQTIQKKVDRRWGGGGCRYQQGHNLHLFGFAIQKYGWENFTHEILEEVEAGTKEELIQKLNQLEEEYILNQNTLVPNGYNLRSTGENHLTSDETRAKMSIGRRGRILSEDHKLKIGKSVSGEKNGMFGKTHSEIAKKKL